MQFNVNCSAIANLRLAEEREKSWVSAQYHVRENKSDRLLKCLCDIKVDGYIQCDQIGLF